MKPKIYITMPAYLHDWLKNDFWDVEKECVTFPRGSAEHIALDLFLKKRPANHVEGIPDSKALPIEVPAFPGKNPAIYCYLNDVGKHLLISTIKNRFKFALWSELHVLANKDIQITDLIYAYMDKHGIEADPKNWETIRQMYLRMRKTYNNTTVNNAEN